MKRIGKLFAILVAAFAIVNPMFVNADINKIKHNAYSKYVSVGSEFIYELDFGNAKEVHEILKFDDNVLEVVKVETVYAGTDDVWGGNPGNLTKTINGNQISIDYSAGDFLENVLVTFKVKKYPVDGVTSIIPYECYTASTNIGNCSHWMIATIVNVIKPTECSTCPTCEKDEVSCPVCEECEKCEVAVDANKDTTSKESKEMDSNDILLYGALGACGFLTVAVVVLAFRKK